MANREDEDGTTFVEMAEKGGDRGGGRARARARARISEPFDSHTSKNWGTKNRSQFRRGFAGAWSRRWGESDFFFLAKNRQGRSNTY